MKYVVGMDGGGRKTEAIVADLEGNILAERVGRPSNVQIAKMEHVEFSIMQLLKECQEAVGTKDIPEILCAGLGGMYRRESHEKMQRLLKGMQSAKNVILKLDATITMEATFEGGPGIILISGTGSIALGRNETGKKVRAGGWGQRLSDEGSGYAISREGLMAVLKAYDGRGPATIMTGKILDKLQVNSVEDVLEKIHGVGNYNIASLIPIICKSAEVGDGVAVDIINRAVLDLTHLAQTVVNRLKFENEIQVVLAGGVFEKFEMIRSRVDNHLQNQLGVKVIPMKRKPAYGALFIALNSLKNTESN